MATEVHSTYIWLSIFAQVACYFLGQTMQNNSLLHAIISKMSLLQHSVCNYDICKQHWSDQTQTFVV